jgi:hypothetical protein
MTRREAKEIRRAFIARYLNERTGIHTVRSIQQDEEGKPFIQAYAVAEPVGVPRTFRGLLVCVGIVPRPKNRGWGG